MHWGKEVESWKLGNLKIGREENIEVGYSSHSIRKDIWGKKSIKRELAGTELKNYDTYYDYDNDDDNDDGYGNDDDNDDGYGNDDDNDDGYGKGRWDVSRGGVLLASLASSNTALKGASCQCW